MLIFTEVPWTGASYDSGLLTIAIFRAFAGYVFKNVEDIIMWLHNPQHF